MSWEPILQVPSLTFNYEQWISPVPREYILLQVLDACFQLCNSILLLPLQISGTQLAKQPFATIWGPLFTACSLISQNP